MYPDSRASAPRVLERSAALGRLEQGGDAPLEANRDLGVSSEGRAYWKLRAI
jgi:hypothetical protein